MQHRHLRPRHAAAHGAKPPQQPPRARLLFGQQCVASPEGFLRPADRPAAAGLQRRDDRRQLVTVQRITHLGAQGVARPEPGQLTTPSLDLGRQRIKHQRR